MTTQQFWKFKMNNSIHRLLTSPPPSHSQIFNYCTDLTFQNSIINTNPEIFSTEPSKLLDMLEVLVIQKSSPMVHRILFFSILQSENEPIKRYLIHFRSGTWDCSFIWLNCNHNSSSVYIKDEFVQGIANDMLQADMLPKVKSLKTLEQNMKYTEAFEMAMQDQNKMSGILDIAALLMSTYHQQKQAQNTE